MYIPILYLNIKQNGTCKYSVIIYVEYFYIIHLIASVKSS